MTLMSWLRAKLNGPRGDADRSFREAVAATDSLTNMARSLRQQLEPFKIADDPLVAMFNARRIAEEYEKQQEANIHHGPKH